MLVNWIPYMPAMRCSTRPLFLWRCTNNYLALEDFSRQEILKQVIVNGKAKSTLKTLKIITIVTCSWFPSNFAPIQGCLTSRKMLKVRWDLMVIIQYGHWDAIFFWSLVELAQHREQGWILFKCCRQRLGFDSCTIFKSSATFNTKNSYPLSYVEYVYACYRLSKCPISCLSPIVFQGITNTAESGYRWRIHI